MASSTSTRDLFELNQVSASVSADSSLSFIEVHGFFYQENATIGRLVDGLYSQSRARSDDTRLEYFRDTLQQDSRIQKILSYYLELPRFRFPWGTTPGHDYNWDSRSSPTVGRGLIAYMCGSKSQWHCWDGSHMIESDGELVANGTFELPHVLLAHYVKREVNMEAGGILLVHTRLVHSAKVGRSIMLGFIKNTA
ncbi:hypothetical protein F5Y08DRAFT_192876 [Xylaria arbuscula]|nr:hypothetical protein F5Y08DRAFT_192876 [Xylaria arbuscula]